MTRKTSQIRNEAMHMADSISMVARMSDIFVNDNMSLRSNGPSPMKVLAESPLKSSITVNEDGAEVVLYEGDSPSKLITPRKLSLLDTEMTPSPLKSMRSLEIPSHGTPRRVSFCGLGECQSYNIMSACGRASPLTTIGDEPLPSLNIPVSKFAIDEETVHMQQNISAILSAPSCENPWVGYWQTWGLSCSQAPSESPARLSYVRERNENIQRVLRNRAFDLNAKRQRLSSLRKDLNPFTSLADATNLEKAIPATRSRSFSGQDYMPITSSVKAKRDKQDVPFLQRAFQCGLNHESPVSVKPEKEDMFYDSDPEDFVNTSRRRKEHSWSENKENVPSDTTRKMSFQEEHQVVAMVQEMMNEQLVLILHDDSNASKQLRPHGVHCWIERGQQLRNTIIAPKLFWKSLDRPKSTNASLRGGSINHIFSSVNLMDISRILAATDDMVDRKVFPFCKASHSFFIKTLEQSLLLEANSSAERDRLVKSLRLVVARLGSLLLTNNDRLADEYFAFFDQGYLGPGEEPYWLANN